MNPLVKAPGSVFIVGCGDIGQRVAQNWQKQGIAVTGLVRSDKSVAQLAQTGITPLQADLDDPATLTKLPALQQTLVYYFAPPPGSGQQDPRMAGFLAALNTQRPTRIVYISTSGVYGDRQGNWVDEQTPPNPMVDRARRRLDAETTLREWGKANSVPVIILRVGGIYGPGRLPIKRIQEQVPMVHEALAPQTNRIHADDLAQVCVAAAQRGEADQIYNVSDGTNSNMTEYFNTIADFLDLPRPPLVDWDEAERTISQGMLSYLEESRRMDNRRMLEELGVKLRYPNLRAGLASCQ